MNEIYLISNYFFFFHPLPCVSWSERALCTWIMRTLKLNARALYLSRALSTFTCSKYREWNTKITTTKTLTMLGVLGPYPDPIMLFYSQILTKQFDVSTSDWRAFRYTDWSDWPTDVRTARTYMDVSIIIKNKYRKTVYEMPICIYIFVLYISILYPAIDW